MFVGPNKHDHQSQSSRVAQRTTLAEVVFDECFEAKKRIDLLDNADKKSVLEEYKEWINDGLNNKTVLLLRDDPII